MKEKAILVGPFLGEMFWEFFRFAPHIVWKRQKQHTDPDIKFIVYTRQDRFDMYGSIADILVPLRIEEKYKQDCYRLVGFPPEEHGQLVNDFRSHFSDRFDIIEAVRPPLDGRNFSNKNYYHKYQMRYKYFPREENTKLVDQYLPNQKPVVLLAPRFRNGLKRNWIYWDKFYELLYKSNLSMNYNFVICGKKGDYVEDNRNRFFDINNIPLNDYSSLIGVTVESIKRSILTIGSQSAIPNISALLGIEVLEWGDQKQFHTVNYNIFKTKITYLDDPKYCVDPEIILSKTEEILEKRRIKNG